MIERALIIKKHWLDLILSGKKTWEIRGNNTKIRGRIGLVESGSGLVVGECDLTSSFYLRSTRLNPIFHKEGFKGLTILHGINVEDWDATVKYKNPHAWVLENAKRHKSPCPYVHPKGAVIWVRNLATCMNTHDVNV